MINEIKPIANSYTRSLLIDLVSTYKTTNHITWKHAIKHIASKYELPTAHVYELKTHYHVQS